MTTSIEIASAVLEPHFDAVRDMFSSFEIERGKPLARLKRVTFEVTERAHSSERHFAATYETGLFMIFAPEIVDKPWETLVAIVAHEFGHAADFAYPGCWSWPKSGSGEALWVGESARARAAAWRALYGKSDARSRTSDDDKPPATNWAFAWQRRNKDQVEWAADAIAEAVTGRQNGLLRRVHAPELRSRRRASCGAAMRARAFGLVPAPPVDPAPLLTEQQTKLGLLFAAVLGGAVIGRAAFSHMFVVGMKEKERHDLLVLAAGSATLYAVVKLLDIDEKWWNLEATLEWAEKEYQASQAGAK